MGSNVRKYATQRHARSRIAAVSLARIASCPPIEQGMSSSADGSTAHLAPPVRLRPPGEGVSLGPPFFESAPLATIPPTTHDDWMLRWGVVLIGLAGCSPSAPGASSDDGAPMGGSGAETGGAGPTGGAGGSSVTPECVPAGESCNEGACCAGTLCVRDSTKPDENVCAALCGTNTDCASRCCVDISGQDPEAARLRVCFESSYCGTTGGTGGAGGTGSGGKATGGAGGSGPTCSTTTCEALPCCDGLQCLEDRTCASECEADEECESGCCAPFGTVGVCAEAMYCNQCETNVCIPGSGCCCEAERCTQWSGGAFPMCEAHRTCYVGCNC